MNIIDTFRGRTLVALNNYGENIIAGFYLNIIDTFRENIIAGNDFVLQRS